MYIVERTKSLNFFKSFDYLLFSMVLLLSGLGLVVLGSVARVNPNDGILEVLRTSLVIKQIVGLAAGIVIAIIISLIDYKDFKVLGLAFYIVSVILLIYVLFKGVGEEEWGSKSWIPLPGFSLQPSEISKISFIIMASIFLERMKENQSFRQNLIKLCIYCAIPVGLVLMQPDYGSALVFIFALAIMIFIYGIPYRYIFGVIAAFVLSTPILWNFVLKTHQKRRILTFIFPEMDPAGASYQTLLAIRTIGSGQLFGWGLGEGPQTKMGTMPVQESDFIFTAVGEEFGFIGSMVIVLLLVLILMRSIYIARNSRDNFGSFLVIGLVGMMGFHFMENIGMCIGILPVTGIPLPFVSSGGSAMITNYMAVGIILSVSMRRKKRIFNSST